MEIDIFLKIVEFFFIIYLLVYSSFLFISVVVGSITLYQNKKRERLKNSFHQSYFVPISIIVPEYNESITVVETVISLLTLDYPLYEIIVVDDGSYDNTVQLLTKTFNMKLIQKPIRKQIDCSQEGNIYSTDEYKVPITLICKQNFGKADTINLGINASKYPYFICMDADSVLQFDSLTKIVCPILENENVIAIGGTVRPSNDVEIENGRVKKYRIPKNIIPCMQMLEYDRSFLASRILFDTFNGSLIISGAFGLFKKDVVIAVGGYDSTTMGEDMELVVKLHEYCTKTKKKYLIKFAPDAICWSQVPHTFADLAKQRRRWYIGLFESLKKHKSIFINLDYGLVSLVSYTYFLIYEFLAPFIEIFGVITIIIAFMVDLVNVRFMILFYIIYLAFGAILTITAFFSRTFTHNAKIRLIDIIKVFFLGFIEISVLRFMIFIVRLTALLGYKKYKNKWGKLKRTKIQFK